MNYIFSCPELFWRSIVVGFGVASGAFACKLAITTFSALVVGLAKKKKQN